MPQVTPAESDDRAASFSFPAASRNKVTAAFGLHCRPARSDAGGLCAARYSAGAVLAVACGYEDADDLDALRDDPGFRLALGKLPGSGAGLASQPKMSRWENAPTIRELARMMAAMVDIYCASYSKPAKAVTLDIDNTCDVVHG